MTQMVLCCLNEIPVVSEFKWTSHFTVCTHTHQLSGLCACKIAKTMWHFVSLSNSAVSLLFNAIQSRLTKIIAYVIFSQFLKNLTRSSPEFCSIRSGNKVKDVME